MPKCFLKGLLATCAKYTRCIEKTIRMVVTRENGSKVKRAQQTEANIHPETWDRKQPAPMDT